MKLIRRSALLVPLLALTLAGCDRLGLSTSSSPAAFKNVDITGAGYGPGLVLPDQHGQTRSLADFRGKVVVVFFGFTQCPDVCPSTMSELARIKQQLGPDGDQVQGIFVTVDPERDTPEVLKEYVASFDPSFVALRGSLEQTAALAKEFKLYYRKAPSKDGQSYSMDHTAGSYIFDKQGQVRLFTRYGGSTQDLYDDIAVLVKS